jgi:hypothetical protein
MDTEPRPRQFEGTYQAAMKRMDVHSPVSKIVHEELDEFFQRVRDRLNNLDSHSSTIEVNNEIKSALAFRFGNPVAKACTTLTKGPNTWNGYQHDNFMRKFDELRENNPSSIYLKPSHHLTD